VKLLVLGAGAWGTALAAQASARQDVTLWARNPVIIEDMRARGVNQRYLPGQPLPTRLQLSHAPLADLVPHADLVVLASPMAALRDMLLATSPLLDERPLAWLCKGFEAVLPSIANPKAKHGLLAHEVQLQVSPNLQAGMLSGPSFAQEVAAGQPAALVAASAHASVRDALVNAFHGDNLRVYANDDIIGVEVGGAVKNVMAIATGLCDGLQLGLNARAALITRGLAEISRLGLAMGARADTFMGLSGLGDLVLTATGDLSRNRQVGLALAQGKSLDQVLLSLGHVAEGVYSAHTVVQRAQHVGVDMPIAQAVVSVLQGQTSPQQAVASLMGRDAKGE